MATYKVPQDVEADDKLIGPFSFRQFIYLIIVAMAIALAWGLAQLFIGLAIIPIPIIIFFGVLALPLRKDQPMEIYMAAMVSFYLKPRQRLWDPEGVETLIEIIAPKTVEVQRVKDLSQSEAAQRLSYLANIVDTGGWAIRGVTGAGTAVNTDVYLEAQEAEDVLDTNTSVAHAFDKMMHQSTERMRQEAKERMFQPAPAPVAAPDPVATPVTAFGTASVQTPGVAPFTAQTQAQTPALAYQLPAEPQLAPQQTYQQQPPQPTSQQAQQASSQPAPHFNPYPAFHQSVIQPLNDAEHRAESDIAAPATPATTASAPKTPGAPAQKEEKGPSTSDTALTAGIMNLANNPDLSIETIAHEAKRLKKKADDASDEVVISLR